MSQSLTLEITLPRLTAGELSFLIHWSARAADKFPHFGEWICMLATDELARRLNPGSEAAMIPLPELTGAKAADFLLASHVLVNQPLADGVAKFADDIEKKVVCDIAGMLEHTEATAP